MMKMLLQRPQSATLYGASSLTSVQEWLLNISGARETASGVRVDEDVAMRFSAVFRAVAIYQNAFKVLPWRVYRRRADGGADVATDHPLHRVLSAAPNREQTAGTVKAYLIGCKKLWGNGYAEIMRGRRGDVTELLTLHPSRVSPERVGGQLVYKVHRQDGSIDELPADAIFHVRGFSRDGISGISQVSQMREAIGLGLAAEDHGGRFFSNGAHPGGLITFPREVERLDERAIAVLRESFRELYSRGNAFAPAILQDGAEYVNIGMPHEDAQWIELRNFQVLDVARFFSVPPHKLAHLADATFSNISDENIQFATESIAPEAVDFYEEADRKLLREEERGEFYTRLDLRGVMRANHQDRVAYYKGMWEMGVYTINDILRLEDMNPIGPAGDQHFVQLNLTTAEKVSRALAELPEDAAARDELAFKRDVVKLLIQDGTIGDVIFNRMEATTLLKDVNVPVDPGAPPVPWVPVVAQPGPLVSGETITDSEGDVVGGAVLAPEAEPPMAPPPEDTDTVDEPAGDAAPARLEAAKAALMPVFVDACDRVLRRQANAVTRARSKSTGAAFDAWAEDFFADEVGKIAEMLRPACDALARVVGGAYPNGWLATPALFMADACKAAALAEMPLESAAHWAVFWTDATGDVGHAA